MEVNNIQEPWNQPPPEFRENKKIAAALLAFFLGSIGVHKFYLGYNNEGIILLILTIVGWATSCIVIGFFILTAIWIITFIEFVIYLTRTDEEFYQTYQVNKKPWF